MASQGSARTRFNRAVESRSVLLAELSAREMGYVDLEAALALAGLYAAEESPKFDKAATRLLARLALERPLRLAESLAAQMDGIYHGAQAAPAAESNVAELRQGG